MTDARQPSLATGNDIGLAPYLPRWVQQHIERTPHGAGASSIRHVRAAVMLVDIVGFKALTEQLTQAGARGAERLRSVLNRYFGQISALVQQHGGDTATFAGDALLAFWTSEDDDVESCLAAARCALAVPAAVSRLATELPAPIRQRLAVDFGALSLLEIAAADARRFTLLTGEPLRGVAETCRAALPETVRVAAPAWRLLAKSCRGNVSADGSALLEHADPGAAVSQQPAASSVPEDRMASYLPRNLVDRLRAGQGEWLAEFRNLSVVFVNLGAVDTAAPSLLQRLESALSVAQAVEATTGGAIYQFLMDDKGVNLILAYGLPLYRQEDDSARAVEAALTLYGRLRGAGFEPSIGVATGSSFCGNCGELRRQYSIIGSPINRAARLMQLAQGGVLYDDATARAADAHFEFEPGPHGPCSPRRRSTISRSSGSGALCGRELELAQLRQRLDELAGGRGGLVLIEGEAGVGKSRLVSELCSEGARRGVRLLQGAGTSLERDTPYYYWREPLRQVLATAATATPAEPAQQLQAMLADRPELLARAPLLSDVLALQLADNDTSRQASGVTRVAAIHDLLCYLLNQVANEQPTLLLIDDLHWLDPSSLDAVSAVLQRVPALLVLGSARPGATSLTKHEHQALRLDTLSREAVSALLAQKLGTSRVPEALSDFAFQRTLGHPLFCEELLLSLRESGAVSLQAGVCSVDEAALERATTRIPETLQGVIVSRIDRLPTAEQLAIKVAGVIGRRFSLRMLHDIYPIAVEVSALERALARLAAGDLLLTEGENEFRFKHALAQESVAELVLFAQRRDLHAQVARWIETHHQHDLDPHVAELAQHWELADDVGKAVDYLERAGEMALRRYANAEAVKALRRALELCSREAYVLSAQRRAHWESLIGHAWHELSDSGRSSQHFARALALRGRRVAASNLQVGLAVTEQLLIQLVRRLGLWRRSGDTTRGDVAYMFARLGEHWYFQNDSFRVLYATLCSLNEAEASGSRRVVDGFGAMGVGLGIAGMHRLARYYLRHAQRRAEQLGNPADIAYAQLLSGVYAAGKADWPDMSEALERASSIYRQLGDPFRWQQSRSVLCFGALVRGDYGLAEAVLQEVEAASARMAFVQVRAWTWSARMALALAGKGSVDALLTAFSAIPTEQLPVSERLLCNGLLAQAQLRSGAKHVALQSASAALDSMLQSPPTAWHLIPGLRGIAETYLELLDEPGLDGARRSELLNKARRAHRGIAEFARRSRACQPLALRLSARITALEGRPRRASRLAAASLLAARRMSLLNDEHVAERELARIAASTRVGLEALGEGEKHDG